MAFLPGFPDEPVQYLTISYIYDDRKILLKIPNGQTVDLKMIDTWQEMDPADSGAEQSDRPNCGIVYDKGAAKITCYLNCTARIYYIFIEDSNLK